MPGSSLALALWVAVPSLGPRPSVGAVGPESVRPELGSVSLDSARGPAPARAAAPARASAPARATMRVLGTVRRAGDRSLVADARILVVPEASALRSGSVPRRRHVSPDAPPPAWVRATTSDADGRFAVDEVPATAVRVIVLAPGYERHERVVREADAQPRRPLTVFLVPDGERPYRTTVAAPRPRPPARVTSRLLSREEIATLPGSQGDSLRALANFPGVARPPGGLGVLVLRGAAPDQSRVFYGEHALPRAFHASAWASVVPADAIASVEFMPGGAPPRFGNLTGGAVALTPATPRRDGWHGHAELDLAGAGAVVQGPVGRGALLLGANRGWVDLVLRAVESVDPTRSFLQPRYYDYQTLYRRPLGGGATLELRALGAGDSVVSRGRPTSSQDPTLLWGLGTQFHRADVAWTKRRHRWRFALSPSFRVERNRIRRYVFRTEDPGVREVARRLDLITSWRAEAEARVTRRASILLGADLEIDPYRTRRVTAAGMPEERIDRDRGVASRGGVYSMLRLAAGRFTVWPGVRVNLFTLGRGGATSVDPSASVQWEVSDRVTLRGGAGLYSQAIVTERQVGHDFVAELATRLAPAYVLPAALRALQPQAGFEPSADEVRIARAVQASTAVSVALSEGLSLDGGVFGRLRDNQDAGGLLLATREGATDPDRPGTFSSSYGLELMLRKRALGKLYGWVAYTLSWAERRQWQDRPGRRDVVAGDFDQRHILTLLASYALPRRWRIGGRFRLVSGSPYTEVVGLVEQPGGSGPVRIDGGVNAARFPVFHQLDLRVDKRWIRPRIVYTAYIDVQNVYNRTNVEAYTYDSEYRRRIGSFALPIFPTIGFRIDY